MARQELFEQLFCKRVGLIKPGLSRMRMAYQALGRPTAEIPSLLIGGTNGKGSTSGFLSLLLGMTGRVGLYTSPHLVGFSERFMVTGEKITDEMIIALLTQVRKELPQDQYEQLSFFEIATLIAMRLFEERSCDMNIFEVGLGGRLDATNITEPMASVIVSIGLDHQEYLGSTYESILTEKLGIIRHGRPLFIGDFSFMEQRPEAARILKETAAAHEAPVWRLGRDFIREHLELTLQLPGLPSLKVRFPKLLQHSPSYLLDNFSVAAAVYYWLQQRGGEKSPFAAKLMPLAEACALFDVRKDLPAPTSMVGRFLKINAPVGPKRQPILFDVCHNIDGVTRFANGLRSSLAGTPNRRLPGLVTILRDKNFDEMFDILKGILDPLVVFTIDNDRSLRPEDLHVRHSDLVMCSSFMNAVHHLQAQLENSGRSDGEPWVVCGSVLAVGKVLEYFEVNPLDLTLDRVVLGDWSFT
jgi:dihydrofolate synthase/folylpolyglutamate synthase